MLEGCPPESAGRPLEAGGNAQRPLWASTGVKDPALPDTLYVTALAVGDTVIYSKYGGTEIKDAGVEYLILDESSLLAVKEA